MPCGCRRHPARGWPSAPIPRRVRAERKGPGVKTLGIKLPDELQAQFALVSQLDGLSLGDALRRAVELYVETKQNEPDFAARARAALDAIKREAAARRHPGAVRRTERTGRGNAPGRRRGEASA